MGGRGVSAGHPAAHTHFRACYATLLRGLYELCLWVVLCLTKPAFMRRPWRITPCPAVHGRAFLFFLGIILQSLSSFAIRLRGSACALPDARRLRHLRCDSNLQFMICGFLVIGLLIASLMLRCQACV